jgi:hypothetical protein
MQVILLYLKRPLHDCSFALWRRRLMRLLLVRMYSIGHLYLYTQDT